MSVPTINASRLHENLDQLARIGGTPDGAVSRVAFSESDIEGRDFVKSLMREAGLSVRVDALGNIFGRSQRSGRDGSAVLLGSHTDTVPNGGAFDGALGVLAAVEVAHTLNETGYEFLHPIEVVVWTDEEGALIGSRGFIGELSAEELQAPVSGGANLAECLRLIGGDSSRAGEAVCRPGQVGAYLELHVEQGGRLESEAIDIGVVTGIVGIRHYQVTFSGVPNHAGTTPMSGRRNALLGASEFVLAVDRVVKSVPGDQVGTVGELVVYPGVANVIPGEVVLKVELRDLESTTIDSLWNMLKPELDRVGSMYGVDVRSSTTHSLPGIKTHRTVSDAIHRAAQDLELESLHLPSGAGHDAQNLARVCPTGMIFVPSVGGVSHSPREHTRPEDVENGAAVLLRATLLVDRELSA